MADQMLQSSSSFEDPLDKEYADLVAEANRVSSELAKAGWISKDLADFRRRVLWGLGFDPDLG